MGLSPGTNVYYDKEDNEGTAGAVIRFCPINNLRQLHCWHVRRYIYRGSPQTIMVNSGDVMLVGYVYVYVLVYVRLRSIT